MTLVELYSKDECHLCDEALETIKKVQEQVPFSLRVFKLMPGDPYFEEYREMFPVVHINKVLAFKYRVSEKMLKIRIQQTTDGERSPEIDPDEPAIEKA
jgi:hypothetical protein